MGAVVDPPMRRGVLASGGKRVALLLPMTGPRAEIGQALARGAQVALETDGAPPVDQKDTGGTPEGAAEAARQAIAAGAGIILGPLTSGETAAVAPIAQAAGVPVLAFTNDAAQAKPGVWTLGIGPAQQVYRLASALQAQGKTRLGGLLPENEVGRAMADALIQSAAALGMPAPTIKQYPPGAGIGALNGSVRELSNYAGRRGPIESARRAASASGTAEGRRRAAEIGRQGVPPAPFDALLVAENGEALELMSSLFAYYDIDRPAVRILGPATWASGEGGIGYMRGAWYAAPDPASRAAFEQGYATRFGTSPPAIAALAFDAGSIARVSATAGGYAAAALVRPGGYVGADGLMVLMADGQVRRGLAIYEIQRGGAQMIEPAPQTLAAPGT